MTEKRAAVRRDGEGWHVLAARKTAHSCDLQDRW